MEINEQETGIWYAIEEIRIPFGVVYQRSIDYESNTKSQYIPGKNWELMGRITNYKVM